MPARPDEVVQAITPLASTRSLEPGSSNLREVVEPVRRRPREEKPMPDSLTSSTAPTSLRLSVSGVEALPGSTAREWRRRSERGACAIAFAPGNGGERDIVTDLASVQLLETVLTVMEISWEQHLIQGCSRGPPTRPSGMSASRQSMARRLLARPWRRTRNRHRPTGAQRPATPQCLSATAYTRSLFASERR